MDCIWSFRECFRSMISIRLDPFWRKNHRNHAVFGSELHIVNEKFLYKYIVNTVWTQNGLSPCGKTAERNMYVSVRCDFEWNCFQIKMSNSKIFENGERSLIWISVWVNIMSIFMSPCIQVFSMAQCLSSPGNDMPETLTRARLPGGTTWVFSCHYIAVSNP